MRSKLVYISEDGKQFETQQDCEAHERKIFTEDKFIELSCYVLDDDQLVIQNIRDLEKFLSEARDWLEPLTDELWHGY